MLDLTRTLSRVDYDTPTGVDRVEREYLKRFLNSDNPRFVASAAGEVFLFGKNTAAALLDRLEGRASWGAPRGTDLLRFKASPRARAARSLLRSNSIAIARSPDRLFAEHDLLGTSYYNIGHSNLNEPVLSFLRHRGAQVHVMVHDLIPLTHPETCRPGTPAQFEQKMRAVALHHDRIICNSKATETDVQRVFSQIAQRVRTEVAHLGLTPMVGLWAPTPDPYFVILGTIEPRKNHAMLLDVWDSLPDPKPELRIIGRRGWSNRAVFKRLDQGVPGVSELGALSDDQVQAELLGARALLFPSLAEGFGLPALEALSLGVPVICSDLAVFSELLPADTPQINPHATKKWAQTVLAFTSKSVNHDKNAELADICAKFPTWESHFRHVLSR